jgi:hypothetical protein
MIRTNPIGKIWNSTKNPPRPHPHDGDRRRSRAADDPPNQGLHPIYLPSFRPNQIWQKPSSMDSNPEMKKALSKRRGRTQEESSSPAQGRHQVKTVV